MVGNFTDISGLTKKQNPHPTSPSKEGEPIRSSENYEIQEVKAHEPQHEEVKQHVAVRPETIELPPDLKKMGLQPVNQTQFPSYQNIKLPLSDDKVVSGQKAPITSSLRWLSTLALYMLKMAHLQLKIVHGKAIRVVKP